MSRLQWVRKQLKDHDLDHYRSNGVWYITYEGTQYHCRTTREAERLLDGLIIAIEYKRQLHIMINAR